MVRIYQRKTTTKYRVCSLLNAARCIQREEISIRSAARRFHVPFSTLRRVYQRSSVISLDKSIKRRGRNPIFSAIQEGEIVKFLVHHNRTKEECLKTIFEETKISEIDVPISWTRNCRAGTEWFSLFLKKYPLVGLFVKTGGRFMRSEFRCFECRQVFLKDNLSHVCPFCLTAICVGCKTSHDCSSSDSD